ncbi:WYL domain-containing protein [Streptomyces sp. NBC_01264]|uniref:WYL domain-containing protein n=1 Tax=Streptomyces sp. NBC_01264 TaxID=2903804 RepID=UPI002259BAC2|nr:WYL domain-containing protein [Streptomyces sp. NBC_01264]MCX4780127.1 WYL domain-containing protein [Streptomyces sp. NBC_01264]
MYRTANETLDRTMVRFLKAMDAKHPVTISYTKADGSRTVRTIEVYDTQLTKAGDIVLKAMDRESGESRTFRLDRVEAYTVHRTAFVLAEPPAVNEFGLRVTVNVPTVEARELAREDREYWSDRYGYDPEYDAA